MSKSFLVFLISGLKAIVFIIDASKNLPQGSPKTLWQFFQKTLLG